MMSMSRQLSQFLNRHEHHCSFCNDPQSAVRQLIAGPSVYICDECVTICHDVVARSEAARGERAAAMGDVSICLVCRHAHAKADCVVVPERGSVCRKCVDRVRAAAGI